VSVAATLPPPSVSYWTGGDLSLLIMILLAFKACAASIACLINVVKIVHSEDSLWVSAEIAIFSYVASPHSSPLFPQRPTLAVKQTYVAIRRLMKMFTLRIIEINIGIIIACVSTFPKFLRTVRDTSLFQSASQSVGSLLSSVRKLSTSDVNLSYQAEKHEQEAGSV
jgi:hypothetical protein